MPAPNTAPPQGPNTASAVATVPERPRSVEVAQDLALSAYAEGRDLERITAQITLPPDYQYVITKNVNTAQRGQPDRWEKQIVKVGLTADGYEYLNRALGASFWFPKWVHDENGEAKRNPIHRPDYIYLRIGIVYYTPLGQRIASIEDIEVDFKLMYQDKRANARSAEPLLDERGALLWDEAGNPGLKLLPADELKCLRELTRSRAFGPRYASTVGRVRLLKMATGIRSLPAQYAGRAAPISIVAYRDKLSPEQRISAAAETLGDLYGDGGSAGPDDRPDGELQRPDLAPLSADEMAEVGLSEELQRPEVDEVERDHVAQARDNEEPDGEPVKPLTAPWSADELGDLGK